MAANEPEFPSPVGPPYPAYFPMFLSSICILNLRGGAFENSPPDLGGAAPEAPGWLTAHAAQGVGQVKM
jgi:hypothetical protein